MTNNKKRTPRKPNVKTVIAALRAGKLDSEMPLLEKAIDARKQILRNELDREIKKLYGDNYEVVDGTNFSSSPRSATIIGRVTDQKTATMPVPEPESDSDEEDFTEDPNGYVSRSPIIGPLIQEDALDGEDA